MKNFPLYIAELIVKNFKKISFIFFILIILSYISWRSFGFIYGPKLTIYYPEDGLYIKEDTFVLKGKIENSKEIHLNGRDINIDQDGNFQEKVISHSPYTIITFFAKDRYGKTIEKTIKVSR